MVYIDDTSGFASLGLRGMEVEGLAYSDFTVAFACSVCASVGLARSAKALRRRIAEHAAEKGFVRTVHGETEKMLFDKWQMEEKMM